MGRFGNRIRQAFQQRRANCAQAQQYEEPAFSHCHMPAHTQHVHEDYRAQPCNQRVRYQGSFQSRPSTAIRNASAPATRSPEPTSIKTHAHSQHARIFAEGKREQGPSISPQKGVTQYYYAEGMLYDAKGTPVGAMAIDEKARLAGQNELKHFGVLTSSNSGAWNYHHGAQGGVFENGRGARFAVKIHLGPPPGTRRTFERKTLDISSDESGRNHSWSDQKVTTVVYRKSSAPEARLDNKEAASIFEGKSKSLSFSNNGKSEQYQLLSIEHVPGESYAFMRSKDGAETIRLAMTEDGAFRLDRNVAVATTSYVCSTGERIYASVGWVQDENISFAKAESANDADPAVPYSPAPEKTPAPGDTTPGENTPGEKTTEPKAEPTEPTPPVPDNKAAPENTPEPVGPRVEPIQGAPEIKITPIPAQPPEINPIPLDATPEPKITPQGLDEPEIKPIPLDTPEITPKPLNTQEPAITPLPLEPAAEPELTPVDPLEDEPRITPEPLETTPKIDPLPLDTQPEPVITPEGLSEPEFKPVPLEPAAEPKIRPVDALDDEPKITPVPLEAKPEQEPVITPEALKPPEINPIPLDTSEPEITPTPLESVPKIDALPIDEPDLRPEGLETPRINPIPADERPKITPQGLEEQGPPAITPIEEDRPREERNNEPDTEPNPFDRETKPISEEAFALNEVRFPDKEKIGLNWLAYGERLLKEDGEQNS